MKSCLDCLLTLSLFFLANSCMIEHEPNGPNSEGGEKSVMLKVSVPHAGLQGPGTRSIGETEENVIETLDLLAFKVDGSSETYQYWAWASKENGHVEGALYQSFSAMLREQPYQQRFIVVTNAHSKLMELLAQADWRNIDKETMLSRLEIQLGSGSGWNATGPANFAAIPMWGQSEPKLIEGATTTLGTIPMLRMVAKINVQVDVDKYPALVSTFKLKSVHVYNINTSGRIVPKSGTDYVGTDMVAKKPSPPAGVTAEVGPLVYTDFSSPGIPDIAMKGAIYLFETKAKNAGNMLEETCIVVGGIYGSNSAPTYYRLDFLDQSGTYLDILRNHAYICNIEEVKGPGFATVDQAYRTKSFDMVANIRYWNEGVSDNVEIEDQYMLDVSRNPIFLTEKAHDLTSTDNILYIGTDYPTGWSATVCTDLAGNHPMPNDGAFWLSISLTATSGPSGTSPDVMQLITPFNIGSAARTAYIHIKTGTFTYVVTVTQDKPAILQPPVITGVNLSPSSSILEIPHTLQFTCGLIWSDGSVDNNVDPSYFSWSVSGGKSNTSISNGLLTPDNTEAHNTDLSVTAVYNANNNIKATAAVTLKHSADKVIDNALPGETVTVDDMDWTVVKKETYPHGTFALLILNDVIGPWQYHYNDQLGGYLEYYNAFIRDNVNHWYNNVLQAPTLKQIAWTANIGIGSGSQSWPTFGSAPSGNIYAFIANQIDLYSISADKRKIGKEYWTSTPTTYNSVHGHQITVTPDGNFTNTKLVTRLEYVRPVIWVKVK
ncbi:MAG: hypothetical protein FWE30_04640 [Bacteroidales bacterium]|nr:hypothetical protein [Bacteroidales bacterium]MCL2738715.1 hypothetical protein [Bacteroidales bacterium]